jgi:2-dehydro-3-deoxygluconokinase
MMPDVVTFGEAMIRLSPPQSRRLEQATSLDIAVGGAELNVAVGVTRLGLQSAWVSCLPQNPLGRMAGNKARELGVDTRWVAWAESGRMGLYFVEYGASPRPSAVTYDRAHSAMSRLEDVNFDWHAILSGARVFHTTGITTALSDTAADQVHQAMVAAHDLGLLVTYDLNYRARLWSEHAARAAQEPMMALVDVLITTEEDTRRVFGIEGTNYEEVARALVDRFGFKIVTVTLRGDTSVLRNQWTAIAYADGEIVKDREYDIEIVDRIGGGDAYAAGFIYGYLGGDVQNGVRYGNALSALKQTTWSDFSWSTKAEVEALLGGASLRIAR